MAAPVYTVETALEIVKLARNDTQGVWLTDAQYRAFIASYITEESAARTFTRASSSVPYLRHNLGAYKGLHNLLLFNNDTTPFTGSNDNVYEVSARGTIWITSGTDSSLSISVNASVIDYGALMKDLYFHLAAHNSVQIAQSFGDVSITPGMIFKYLIEMGSHWEGVR